MLNIDQLNPEQKKAVTHKDGPLLIVAGAGTGKTSVVTSRVAWLIDQKLAKPDEILCLTFTDKAAGEMEERIDKLLPYGYVDLWVMTFHAFCERILKQHGLEMGLPADFKLVDSTAQWMLVQNNLDQFELDHYKPMGNPTKFISAMLTHFSRAKDEAVTAEDYLDYVQDLSLDADSPEFLKFGETVKRPKKSSKKTGKFRVSSTKDAVLVSVKELWTQEIARQKELANAYHTYQRLLVENNSLDFGDLIVYCRKLFLERPYLLAQYRKQFKYILVDEFQDTNWAQYELVKMLAQPNNNITVVGDDDQSIYKFRGASLSNILGFNKDFPKAKQVVLTTNYRSTQNILDLSYRFIQNNNPYRLEYQLNEGGRAADVSFAGRRQDLSGLNKISKELKAHSKKKGTVEHLHYASLNEEVIGTVNKIIELRKNDPEINWSDFAILVRANHSAEPFLQQLTLAEIPFQFLASQGLFSQAVVLDLISYLKLLDSYAESTALYRILILPTIDLHNDDLMALLLQARKKGISLLEALRQAPNLEITSEGQKKCVKVLEMLTKHSTMARTKRVSEIAMAFTDDFGLKQYYETLDPLQQKQTYSLLNHFWRFMQKFESEQDDKTIKPFLQYLRMISEAGDSGSLPQDMEEGPDTVKVMTIHASKGLEFKHVFVVNMVDRRFPTSERKDPIPLPAELIKEVTPGEKHHLEEERRLCYVALTRAKEGLYLTSGEDYGGARKKKLSKFIYELGFKDVEPLKLESKIQWGESMLQSFEVVKAKTMDYKQWIPKTFSYTQLKVFETCPWQYRYAFILKIPVQGRHTFSFGKSMHNTLEKFFNIMLANRNLAQASMFGQPFESEGGGQKAEAEQNSSKPSRPPTHVPSLKELYEIYEASWIDDWYNNAKHQKEYKQKGKDVLREFYSLHKGHWPNTVATEKGFTLKVGAYTLRGSIDRVDEVGGKLILIDYKTGKVPKTNSALDKDQLLIYQIASEEVLEEPVEELTYYYLNENVAKSFLGKDKDKDKLKEKIVETLDKLTESKFEPKPAQMVCKNCDYKDICTYSLA